MEAQGSATHEGAPRRPGDRRGFTLIELIVVMVIVAMAMAITTFEVGRRRDRSLFMAEVRRLSATLKAARQRAVMERTAYAVLTGTDTEGVPYYWLEREGRAEGGPVSLPFGFELTETEIVFYPRGYATEGELLVRDDRGHEALIRVDPILGEVRVER